MTNEDDVDVCDHCGASPAYGVGSWLVCIDHHPQREIMRIGCVWREAVETERAQWAVDQWVATGDETPLHEAGLIGSFLCLLRAELRKERGRG